MKSNAASGAKYAYNERYFFMRISAFHKQQQMRQVLAQNTLASVATFECKTRVLKIHSCTYSMSGIENT